MDDYDTDEFGWQKNSDINEEKSNQAGGGDGDRNNRNNRYKKAYGNYGGGYAASGYQAPPLGFGPDPGYVNDSGFGPEPNFGPNFFSALTPKPLFAMGRGYGPNGPPMKSIPPNDKAFKYLLHCGVPRDSIKNLPKDFLQQISPQHCGICSKSFDTYLISRVHYNSKNHTKNQQRWLSQKHDGGFSQYCKEVPLKARELYCELCDVQITSTPHCNSHYAGKPHRAIVEGRRLPKNTLLLQKGMEERLEQLIRREKKALKSIVIEAAIVETIKEKTKNPPVPGLYCEICKTSMTCTEQMTTHLNGKRHLAKEKSHILMTMKQQAAKPVTGKANADSDANKEKDKDAIKSKDNETDSAEWGEGTGVWDDL